MIRIVGGTARGSRIAPPQDNRIRPTSDRAREALFNMLAHNPLLNEGRDTPLPRRAHMLDVFAGCGAVGIEALSRGAAEVVFLDNDPAALSLIRRNLRDTKLGDRGLVLETDATNPMPAPYAPADLVYLDPPYGDEGKGPVALEALTRKGWVAAGALCILESDGKRPSPPLPAGFTLLEERRWGRIRMSFLRRQGRTDKTGEDKTDG